MDQIEIIKRIECALEIRGFKVKGSKLSPQARRLAAQMRTALPTPA